MDPSRFNLNTRTQSSQPCSSTQLQEQAVQRITSLTKGSTTVQQLSALHYAWGGMDTDPSSGYAKNFENSKETFLKTVKNGSALQEAKKVLITQIRAQICEQLPAELSMRLNAMYQSCQEKLSTDQSFG